MLPKDFNTILYLCFIVDIQTLVIILTKSILLMTLMPCANMHFSWFRTFDCIFNL